MTFSNRLIAVVVMVTLFLVGAVAGGVTVSVLGRDDPQPRAGFRPRGPMGPSAGVPPRVRGFAAAPFVDRLARELDLSEAQRDSVEAILDRQRRAAEETLREVAPRLRAGVDSVHDQIRAMLEGGQRSRFDEMIQRDRGVLGRRYLGGIPEEGRRP